MMDIDLLSRDQKVEFVERVHELARLAEEWARSTTPLNDVELDRFQLLCNEFGVSESSLIARYQRKAREEAIDRTFSQRVPPPKYFDQLPMPKRVPQPILDAESTAFTPASELLKTVPPKYDTPEADLEGLPDLRRDSRGNPVPAGVPDSKVTRPVPDSKAKRVPGPAKAKVVSAVPSDPHGKITMAPPPNQNEQTTSIAAISEETKK